MNSDKNLITAENLYDLQVITDPQISPDGKHIIFNVQRVDRDSEKKYSNLWIVPTDGGETRQFTYGDQRDRHARWSPDGREIAFLSNRQEETQEQIYIIPFFGGEARPLTKLKGSFAGFEWSPGGETLAFQFRSKDAEAVEREADEQKKKLGVVARRITSLEYKAEGAGFLPQEKWHIWTVDTSSAETQQLTEGDHHNTGPRWSPDGSQILFLSNRSPHPDKDIDAIDLFLIPAEGGEETKIEAPYGRKFNASFSPDGQWIAYLGREKTGAFYQNNSLYILPVNGGESRNLTKPYDLHLELATVADIDLSEGSNLPIWSLDGQFIYVMAVSRGDQPLLAIAVSDEGGEPQRVIEEPGVIGEFSFDATQDGIAALWSFLSSTGQVVLKEQNKPGITILTQFNQDLLTQLELGEIEEITFTGPGGEELDGWILKPPDFDPNRQYPSILEIHGGPQTQYGRVFMHEFYYLAAQGYVVSWCNPRGSQGYGEDFSGAIFNNWGTVDYDDIMAWADLIAEKPYIDSSRMGVAGGSYGGYMTIWVIGHTDRFKAAVAQRLVSNFISFHGSSDMNMLSEHLVGTLAPPWEDIENYWRQSPMSAVGNASTPTLIIHSLNDLRVPSEQGEQVFVALQQKGVDSELVLFPDESHGLSRNGRTDRRVARLEHMARWFEKYLKQD
ncbi:MAG: S9 family peptidase [Candidatus Promineifilaceae bacterium]|jgi:dipeptidyl aminopeptidase/acylaminoacyl peptidase